ncbi:MAG: hypothetical protein KAH99_03705 [Verrucomicrobia bacterium]|nr:hypothetical protein [Verrucomicrobiota bacterium]
MKSMKYIAVVASLALLMGCATTFRPWLLSEIEEGMERAQVIRILGEPDSAETKNGAEFLHYSYREDFAPLLADNSTYAYEANRRVREQQIRKSLKEYRYAVKLVDGKVQSYKELVD